MNFTVCARFLMPVNSYTFLLEDGAFADGLQTVLDHIASRREAVTTALAE